MPGSSSSAVPAADRREHLLVASQCLGLPLSAQQADLLLAYLDLLQRWGFSMFG